MAATGNVIYVICNVFIVFLSYVSTSCHVSLFLVMCHYFLSCVIISCLVSLFLVMCHYFLSCVIILCHLPFYIKDILLFLDHHVTESIAFSFLIAFQNYQPFANRVARKPVFLTELFDTNFMIIVCLLDCRLKLDGILVPQILTFLYFLIGPDTCR